MASMKFRAKVVMRTHKDLMIHVTRACRVLNILPDSYVDVELTPVRGESGFLKSDAVPSCDLIQYFEREGDEDCLDFDQEMVFPHKRPSYADWVAEAEKDEMASIDYAPVEHIKDIVAIPASFGPAFVAADTDSNEDNVDLDVGVDWDELEDCEKMYIPADREAMEEVGEDLPEESDGEPVAKDPEHHAREELE